MNRTWNSKEGTAIGEMDFIRTVSTHRIYSVYIYVGLECGYPLDDKTFTIAAISGYFAVLG